MADSEKWLADIEAGLAESNHCDASTIAERQTFCETEVQRLTQLFNDLTSNGPNRISKLCSTKEEFADEGVKERKRQLKARYDSAVKLASSKREQCAKEVSLWKEAGSIVSGLNTMLEELEKKVERAHELLDAEASSQELKEAVQNFTTRAAQIQRISEVRVLTDLEYLL